jgi:crotonobetainyl-CoA:carnitine CoA-transferase CaiB-like acyl-CoA transferase
MAIDRKLSPTHEAPYRGLRVLDFGQGIASPYCARLHAADLIAERILNPGEWLHDVYVEATRAAVCQQTPGMGPVYSPRTPGIASFSVDDLRPAHDIGQDSYEVLLETGFEHGAIDDLVKAGAVRQAKGGTA